MAFLMLMSVGFGFIFGTQVIKDRPIVKKEVTEIKCDKTAFEIDAKAAKDACYSTNLAEFHYEDNGKGDKVIPTFKCKD